MVEYIKSLRTGTVYIVRETEKIPIRFDKEKNSNCFRLERMVVRKDDPNSGPFLLTHNEIVPYYDEQ